MVSGSPSAVDHLASSGIEFVGVDLQHAVVGSVGSSLHNIIRAAEAWELPVIVRVPWRAPEYAMQVLDAGAIGVIFPMVNSPQEAEEAAEWCRFPPRGRRSWGPVRASLGDTDYSPATASQDLLVFMMIETAEGAKNAKAIANTPGVDGIYVGPTDLTISMTGTLPSANTARSDSLVTAVLAELEGTQSLLGTPVGSADEFEARRRQGFRLIPVSSDMELITSGMRAHIQAIGVE